MTWFDLTQPLHEGVPHSAALPGVEIETLRCVAEDGANVQRVSVPTHVGTHVDAPRHFVPDGPTIDDLPLDRFAGEGVVLDLERDEAGEISREDFEAAAAAVGGIQDGDIVLVRTGWGATYEDHEAYQRYPWLAPEVGDLLVSRNVKLLGVDTLSPDRPRAMRPDGWDAYPLHRQLLPEGVLIAEHLFLEAVAGRRLELCGFPVKLRGGDGAPIRMAGRELD